MRKGVILKQIQVVNASAVKVHVMEAAMLKYAKVNLNTERVIIRGEAGNGIRTVTRVYRR